VRSGEFVGDETRGVKRDIWGRKIGV